MWHNQRKLTMNAIQFSLLIKDKELTTIYTGDEHGCRCGCRGRYFKPGDKGFTRALNKAKDLDPIVKTFATLVESNSLNSAIAEQTKNEYDGTVRAVGSISGVSWVDICTGNGKTITVYYK